MDIKYNNTTILSFEPKGKETRELMSECFVETSFASSTLHTLKAGYYIDVDSKRYWLKEDYKPRKDPQTGGYVYDLRFYGLESILADHICFFITPTSEEVNWTLTGTLTQIGQVIADNIERAGLGTFTILGSEVIASISGNESSILDVLNDVVNKWGVEWWFEGSVLKFGECKGVDAVDFVVGDVIKDYTEENSMDSDFATRLYAFGSTKNITSDYRNTGTIVGMVERRLRMPVAVGDYIDIPNATRVVEKVKIYEECYPHRVGTLSAAYKVGSFWRFKDSASPFNPLTEPIVKADGSAGNKISVIFESGDLAGREFELLFFADNGEYVYEVVAKNEGDNIDLSVPNDTLHPNIGDTYSLFGMVMPASFITLEESNLQAKATADLTKMYSDKSNYSCPTNGVYCRANNKKYYIGQNVNLTRHDGTIINTRIRKVERDLYDNYNCVYTLGNKQRYSLYNDLNEKIERPLTLKQIQSSITTIIEDGAITQSERASLSMALKQFESEFLAVDAAFDVVYANTYLTAEVKADLLSKFNAYSSKYTALVNTINGAITDDVITQTERSAIDTGFAEYNAAYAALSTSIESAKKSVTDSIGTTLSAWTADGVISPLEKIAIKQTRTQITSEKEALVADAAIYEVDDEAFLTAWAAYDTALAKYSADTPENISIEGDFATTEANYKSAKVSLITAITSTQKTDTGAKHPLGGSSLLDFTAKNIGADSVSSDEMETPDIHSPGFTPGGFMGSGFGLKIDSNGKAIFEVDELLVRQSAKFYELIIQQLKHQGGIVFYTAASMEVLSVTEQADSYRCFFDTKQGQLTNEWAVNDQARCQRFAGKYYWRLVTAVGTDYIDLSKADTNGAGVPEKGDVIVQLGNRTDTSRQAAKVTTVIGVNSPRDEFYEGINSFDLTGKLITIVGMKDGKAGIYTVNGEFAGKVAIGAGSTGLTGLAEWAGAALDIQDAQSIANQAVQSAASLQNYVDNTLLAELSALQEQIDGQVVSWDFPYAPTLSNFPASEWTTDVIKDRHIHDTFYNNQPFVDNETTPDAGKAWRFTKSEGVYFWNPISDSDAVKALADAARAQDTADGKKRVFVTQPTTPYDVGDLWTQGSGGELMRCINQRLSGAYVAGDWEKAVKYTDDTAVNNLQVGVRNLIKNSYCDLSASVDYGVLRFSDFIFIQGQEYTFIVEGSTNILGANNGAICGTRWPLLYQNIIFFDSLEVKTYKQTFIATETTVAPIAVWSNRNAGSVYIKTFALYAGNKADDWMLAPEDVTAGITEAKEDAAAAQSSADTANAAVANLNTYVDGSFKDGVISEAEAQAIEKYTNSVNASKLQIQSAYAQLYANAYLEGTAKSNLAAAKTAIDTAITNLLASIAAAIADGQTTPTEKADVDAKFALYNSALSTYQTRVEEANKAIQDKLKTYSDSASLTATEAKNYIDNVLPNYIASLQEQLDGVVDTWYFAYAPTLANFPASDWTTDTIKARHVGDTFTNTQPFISDVETPDAGKSWRFLVNAGVYSWSPISDSDAVKALLAASKAQDTADGKRRNFVSQPTTPYDIGDLWSQGSAGDLMICNTPRLTGSFNAADWGKAVKYTDDTAANAAATAASNAQTAANTANTLLADIASDNKLTPVEKKSVRAEWDTIAAEKSVNDAQADTFGITTEKATYGTKFQALANYLNNNATWSSGVPVRISDENLSVTTDIVGSTFRLKFKEYYDARTALLNAIAAKAKTLADNAQTAANNAATAASNAQSSANTANSLLSDIASDSKFTPVEKQQTKIEWDAIVSEKVKNDAQADVFSVSKTAYGTKYTALSDYITPLLANLAVTSDIIGTDFRAKFKEYYDARTDLLNAIASAAKSQAISDAAVNTTNKINAVQIGFRNLIKNSYCDLSTSVDYGVLRYSDFKFEEGKEYTFIVEGSTNILGAGNGAICGTRWPLWYQNVLTFDSLEVKKYIYTFIATASTTETINVWANRNAGSVYIKSYALYKGSKGEDWTPAVEDTQAAITNAQATADVAAAKTEGFTEIEGGLVTTNIIKLMDALAAAETAGINGMKGNGSNPAFWAGGTYAQALQMIAAIVLKHNGAGKIGDLIIEENGTVVVKEPATGQIRVVWNATELPLLADLLSQSQISDSEINSAANRTTPGTTTLANTLVVTKANSKLTFDADISGYVNAPSAGTALISVAVNLYKDGVLYTPITSFNFRLQNPDNPSDSFTETIDFVLNSVPVGTYSVTLEVGATSDGSSDWVVNATLGASTLAFLFEQDIQQVRYGLDGLMAFYSAFKYFYLTSKSGVPFLSMRGELDIPGLRGSGSVSLGGLFSNRFGKASDSVRNSTGLYTISHTLGHTNYGVNLSIFSSNGQLNAVVTAKNNTSFDVRIVNASNNALTDSAFDFSIYGNE